MTIAGFFVEINLRKKSGSIAAHITQKSPLYQNVERNLQKS